MTTLFKRIIIVCAALTLVLSMAACGETSVPQTEDTIVSDTDNSETSNEGTDNTENGSEGILKAGFDRLTGQFNPFYPGEDGDAAALDIVCAKLLGNDREGNVILNGIEGETIPYDGKDYTYNGIADCVIGKTEDGLATYDITVKENVRFSDDVPMNADDIIFTMYVLSDPVYDGPEKFGNLPILGMKEYRSDRMTLFDAISQSGRNNTNFDAWDSDTQEEFWKDVDIAGVKFVKEIMNWLVSAGYNDSDDSVAECMANWGFEVPEEADEAMAFDILLEEYQGNIKKLSEIESAGSTVMDYMKEYDRYNKVVEIGEKVENIKGIEKTGEYSVRLTMSEYDVNSIYALQFYVNPLHYYGNVDLYDYDNNMFGIEKGNLAKIVAASSEPLGAGPYKLADFSEGKAAFEENEHFYLGNVKTKKVVFTEIENDGVMEVYGGNIDICKPAIDTVVLETIKTLNSNKSISGSTVSTALYDKAGYGYIGISAENVKVGEEKNSAESKALRKAFATMFSKYRKAAVSAYYGDTASVIEYPVSGSSWAAPRPSDEGYETAFSVPEMPIDKKWTPFSNDDEKEDDGTLSIVIEYLKNAGFKYDENLGKFTDAPEGAKLAYEVLVPAKGLGDHPCYEIFTSAQAQFRKIGITLKVIDVADSNVIWEALDKNKAEIWAAAWGPMTDPDLYDIYHSDNYGMGTKYNYFGITSEALDELIRVTRESTDRKHRKELYKKCYDIILEWAVEVPVYQRKNATLFSSERINMDTIPSDSTVYYGWLDEAESIEMK